MISRCKRGPGTSPGGEGPLPGAEKFTVTLVKDQA